jgi:hypothetical protein
MFTDKLQSFAREARLLIENHRQLLVESPSAFRPLLIRQLRSWEGLFPPERESLTWMMSALARQTAEQRQGLFKNIEAIQLPELADLDLLFDEEKLLERCLRHFKKNGTYQTWRLAVNDVFQILTSGLESQRSSRPKLVMAILGEGTGRAQTVEDSDQRYLSYFWNHLQPLGTLFARIDGEPGDRFACAPLFTLFRKHLGMPQIRTWAIETGTELKPGNADHAPTWFSFEHLKPVMERVTRKMADEMLAGVTGPEALYAKLTDFKMDELGLPDYDDLRIRKFIEQVIVSGSGALVINNSFAEWTALQALRRVEPDLLVVRFGARRRFVPLRQLDPFGPGSQGLEPEDAGESLQDADVLTYYVWLETRKNPRYRDSTYFLIYLEGSRAGLLLGPAIRKDHTIRESVTSQDLVATLARLVGVSSEGFGGRVLHQALNASS